MVRDWGWDGRYVECGCISVYYYMAGARGK